jgi:hypothetical protein
MATFLKGLLFPRQVLLEKRILSLANKTKEFLLPQDLQNILDDIEYNEFGVAFETLCAQLFECEASISPQTYTEIETLGKDIGIDEEIWKPLRELLKND